MQSFTKRTTTEEHNDYCLASLGIEAWRSGQFLIALYKDGEIIASARTPSGMNWNEARDFGFDAMTNLFVPLAVYKEIEFREYPCYDFELVSKTGVRCFYQCS